MALTPPKALAQASSNFPADTAGMAVYVKYDSLDFNDIHRAASSVGSNILRTDGSSYVYMTIGTVTSGYELYADVSGWGGAIQTEL